MTQERGFVGCDCALMRRRITAIVHPVLNQRQIVPDTPLIDPHPMNALNPFALKSILLQSVIAQSEKLTGLLLTDRHIHHQKLPNLLDALHGVVPK